jgi:predicted HTH transcriptional regulator
LAFLAENNTASAREAAAALGISRRAVGKHLAALKAKGLLKRIGPDKGGHWEVVK